MKKIYFLLLFLMIILGMACKITTKNIKNSTNKNFDAMNNHENINSEIDANNNMPFENKELRNELLARIDFCTNIFNKNEDPLAVWYDRNAMVTSLVLKYINANNDNISADIIASIPTSTSYVEPYYYDSPDGLFRVHMWFVPYGERAYGLSSRFFEGYSKLNIMIVQYETESGKKITFPMDDIINQIEISNVRLSEQIRKGYQSRLYRVVALKNSMYLLGTWFRVSSGNFGNILFVVKNVKDKFVLHKAFNNKNFLLFFTDQADWDRYVITDFELDAEYVLFQVKKTVDGDIISGHDSDIDTRIYDHKDIKLLFNGHEFIGDYEKLLKFSKISEPANFQINGE